MRAELLRRDLLDHWRPLAAWLGGTVLLVAMYAVIYPTVHAAGVNIQQFIDQLPKGFRDAFLGAGVDYSSPTGYLSAELFSFLMPVLLIVAGVVAGSRALAAEEGNGTIDVLMSTPVQRRRLALERAVGAQLPVLAIAAVAWAAVAVIGPSQQLTVGLGSLAIALAAVALLGVCFGMLAFFVGAATGKRALAAGVAAALGVATYAANFAGASVASITGVANAISPFHWSGGPGALSNGVEWSGWILLVVCPIVLLVASVLVYERRDLTAGG